MNLNWFLRCIELLSEENAYPSSVSVPSPTISSTRSTVIRSHSSSDLDSFSEQILTSKFASLQQTQTKTDENLNGNIVEKQQINDDQISANEGSIWRKTFFSNSFICEENLSKTYLSGGGDFLRAVFVASNLNNWSSNDKINHERRQIRRESVLLLNVRMENFSLEGKEQWACWKKKSIVSRGRNSDALPRGNNQRVTRASSFRWKVLKYNHDTQSKELH